LEEKVMADSDNRTDYEKLGDLNPIFAMEPTGKAASIYESDASKKPVEPEEGFVERALPSTVAGVFAGAGLGALTKKLLPPPTAPTTKVYDAARAALDKARATLQYFQNLPEVPADVLLRAQQDLHNANLRIEDISRELGEIPRPAAVAPPAVATPATPEAPPSRKIAGSSGAANYTRALSDDIPYNVAEEAKNYRGNNPKGGQYIIDKQMAAVEKSKGIAPSIKLSPYHEPGQIALPQNLIDEEVARRAAAAEKAASDLATRQAAEQAVRNTTAQDDMIRRLRLETQQRQQSAAISPLEEAVRNARKTADLHGEASIKAEIARIAAEKAAETRPGVLSRYGHAIASNPMFAKTLAGAGIGLSLEEAIHQWDMGNKSMAVLSAIEAGLGAASLPPFLPAKAVGMAGGLGLGAGQLMSGLMSYFGDKYSLGTSKEAAEAFRPSSPPRRQ